jgi:uncharacterized protein (DUF2267 family)
MNYQSFVEQVAKHSGMDRVEVEAVIASTCTVLGSRLRLVDARAVATHLPAELAERICAAAQSNDPADTTVLDRRIGVVCRMMAGLLDEQGRAHLRMQPLTSLFMN